MNSIENEKDPRNLKLIFDTIHQISKFPVLSPEYIEEFFESIFCYFPVTFKTNPNDPKLISVEELKESLKNAISGDSKFGDLAIPLLIEKLSSNSSSAKIDSLNVLLNSCDNFDKISFTQFRFQLEISIFSEIVGNADTKIQLKSLEILRKLSILFSKTEDVIEAEVKSNDNNMDMDETITEDQDQHVSVCWMTKFLSEVLKSFDSIESTETKETDRQIHCTPNVQNTHNTSASTEIVSKSALIIEAISNSSENCFKFSLKFLLEKLLEIAIKDSFSFKGRIALNCLVALFSPLKLNRDWESHLTAANIDGLERLFNSTAKDTETSTIKDDVATMNAQLTDAESFSVYLVIFSFISSCLSFNCSNSFISNFLSIAAVKHKRPSNELKNCLWLASKSCPNVFINQIGLLENDQIISATSSTSELTTISLNRLKELNSFAEIETVLLKSDLSKVSNDLILLENLLLLAEIDKLSIIKLFASLSSEVQSHFIAKRIQNFEIILIGTRPEVIEKFRKEIKEELPKFKNPNTITSIFNKCPNLWMEAVTNEKTCTPLLSSRELILFACKGLIFRMDPLGLQILKDNFNNFDSESFLKMFKIESELLSSTETFHYKKSLYLQWFLNWLIPLCNHQSQSQRNPLTVLISVLEIIPKSLILIHSRILPELIINYLNSSNGNYSKAWEVLIDVIGTESCGDNGANDSDNFTNPITDRLVELALSRTSFKKESSSLIRFHAMKLLCRLIEIPSMRQLCSKWQDDVLLELKNFEEPKRSVRQEAARANNLWIVLHEDVFQ